MNHAGVLCLSSDNACFKNHIIRQMDRVPVAESCSISGEDFLRRRNMNTQKKASKSNPGIRIPRIIPVGAGVLSVLSASGAAVEYAPVPDLQQGVKLVQQRSREHNYSEASPTPVTALVDEGKMVVDAGSSTNDELN
jgi:hypothetical protein